MIDNGPFFLRLENVVGEKTGETYNGEFQVKKYLSHKEGADVARLTESLCSGIFRQPETMDFLANLAELSFHITKAPEWYSDKGFALMDRSPVLKLHELLLELQKPPETKSV